MGHRGVRWQEQHCLCIYKLKTAYISRYPFHFTRGKSCFTGSGVWSYTFCFFRFTQVSLENYYCTQPLLLQELHILQGCWGKKYGREPPHVPQQILPIRNLSYFYFQIIPPNLLQRIIQLGRKLKKIYFKCFEQTGKLSVPRFIRSTGLKFAVLTLVVFFFHS